MFRPPSSFRQTTAIIDYRTSQTTVRALHNPNYHAQNISKRKTKKKKKPKSMTDWVGLFQENYSNFHPGHETKGNFGAGLFFGHATFKLIFVAFPQMFRIQRVVAFLLLSSGVVPE
jgi:hypothetical protein